MRVSQSLAIVCCYDVDSTTYSAVRVVSLLDSYNNKYASIQWLILYLARKGLQLQGVWVTNALRIMQPAGLYILPVG